MVASWHRHTPPSLPHTHLQYAAESRRQVEVPARPNSVGQPKWRTHTVIDSHSERQPHRQTATALDKHSDRQAHKQTGTYTDRHRHRHSEPITLTYNYLCWLLSERDSICSTASESLKPALHSSASNSASTALAIRSNLTYKCEYQAPDILLA